MEASKDGAQRVGKWLGIVNPHREQSGLTLLLLGRLGQGSLVFRHAMLWERSLLAALAVGTMRRQLTEVTDAAQAYDQQAETAVIAVHVALAATLLITVVTVAALVWERAPGDPPAGRSSPG